MLRLSFREPASTEAEATAAGVVPAGRDARPDRKPKRAAGTGALGGEGAAAAASTPTPPPPARGVSSGNTRRKLLLQLSSPSSPRGGADGSSRAYGHCAAAFASSRWARTRTAARAVTPRRWASRGAGKTTRHGTKTDPHGASRADAPSAVMPRDTPAAASKLTPASRCARASAPRSSPVRPSAPQPHAHTSPSVVTARVKPVPQATCDTTARRRVSGRGPGAPTAACVRASSSTSALLRGGAGLEAAVAAPALAVRSCTRLPPPPP